MPGLNLQNPSSVPNLQDHSTLPVLERLKSTHVHSFEVKSIANISIGKMQTYEYTVTVVNFFFTQ